jgi:hypothetical protein
MVRRSRTLVALTIAGYVFAGLLFLGGLLLIVLWVGPLY